MLHDICVAKTGTLTTGVLDVVKFHVCSDGKAYENSSSREPDYFKKRCPATEQIKDFI